MEIRYCKQCGDPIPFNPKYDEKYYSERNFCSYSCNGKYQNAIKHKPYPERFCLYCGRKLIPGDWDYPKSFANRKYCNNSCSTKANWQNPDYRERVVKNSAEGIRKYARTPEARAKQSKLGKANWECPEYRKNATARLKEYNNDPEVRQKRSERAIETWAKPGHREHVSKVNREITLALWQDSEYVEKVMKGQNLSPNKPESQLIEILNELEADFEFTGAGGFQLAGKIPDFVSRKTKQIIEMYGNYWHTETEAIKRTKLFNEHGFETLIIWDTELVNIDDVKAKILDFTNGALPPYA